MLVAIINGIINIFPFILNKVIGLLPNTPFTTQNINDVKILKVLNFFVPIGGILSLLTLYVAAVAVWYAIRWIMRFVKYIE